VVTDAPLHGRKLAFKRIEVEAVAERNR